MATRPQPDPLYCRAITLSGIDRFLAARGVDPKPLFSALRIPVETLHQPDAFLPWNRVCALFESAARQPGLARFGLLWSRALPPDDRQIGPLLHLASLSETGRDYVHLAARYQLTHKNGLAHSIHEDTAEDTVAWRATPHPRSAWCRQIVEFSLSNSYRQVAQFLSTDGIRAIHFTYDAPEDLRPFTQHFACPVIFGASHNQLIADSGLMDRDLRAASPALRQAVQAYLQGRVRTVPGAARSLARTLDTALPALFGVNRSDMASVAGLYQLSEKKLQRLLRDEGTSFAAVRDAARQRLARTLLTTTQIPIARLAIFLDYASPSAFHQACKRWFGLSPREVRKAG